ncbi:MAG: Trm112 family protein [Candidatus Aenigmarchaeota archaeon]|nr:Trm112 family protein [Candidatus Aenigmarchaeota archaeon]
MDLLNILACPTCKGPLTKKGSFLLCNKCSLAFPIQEGVPNLLPEEAWPLKKAQKACFRHTLKL